MKSERIDYNGKTINTDIKYKEKELKATLVEQVLKDEEESKESKPNFD